MSRRKLARHQLACKHVGSPISHEHKLFNLFRCAICSCPSLPSPRPDLPRLHIACPRPNRAALTVGCPSLARWSRGLTTPAGGASAAYRNAASQQCANRQTTHLPPRGLTDETLTPPRKDPAPQRLHCWVPPSWHALRPRSHRQHVRSKIIFRHARCQRRFLEAKCGVGAVIHLAIGSGQLLVRSIPVAKGDEKYLLLGDLWELRDKLLPGSESGRI
mmetsp:Transcript_85178/g.170165  ORF Transcript_85178/g.170165 Transcript_85178/m.170165 type:complete len:217 (-) Transcript_85178:713-1363(-)